MRYAPLFCNCEVDMNSGVELIIERIKDCPEEFFNDGTTVFNRGMLKEGKWEDFISGVFSRKKQIDKVDTDTWGANLFFLNDDEIIKIYDVIRETLRERFIGDVLETIAKPEKSQSVSILPNNLFAGGGGGNNLVWSTAQSTLSIQEEGTKQFQKEYAKCFKEQVIGEEKAE